MDEKFYNRVVSRYIDGKKLKTLKQELIEQGLNESEVSEVLKKVHQSNLNSRLKTAKKDLIYALVFISINIVPVFFYILEIKFKMSLMLAIAAAIAWRPFLVSYINVRRDKKNWIALTE